MSEFLVYLQLGLGHILDPRGYDHILFVAALTAAYGVAEWRRLVGLVTAFTLGHSATLALATTGAVHAPAAVVETLIPVTIVIAALTAARDAARSVPGTDAGARRGGFAARYAMAAVFGLVHGLGFSSFLRAALGAEESIVRPLLAFNVGLELGQVGIVAAVLALGVLVQRVLGVARRDWLLFLSGATAGIGAVMIVDRITGS